MRLSAKALQEFKDICNDEFGVALSDEAAERRALALLDLVWLATTDAPSLESVPHAKVGKHFDGSQPEAVR